MIWYLVVGDAFELDQALVVVPVVGGPVVLLEHRHLRKKTTISGGKNTDQIDIRKGKQD